MAIIEFLIKFVGLPFEYPSLFPAIVLVAAGVVAWRYTKYRWKQDKSGFLHFWLKIFTVYLLSVLTLSPLAWLFSRFWGLPHPFAQDDIGILIAEVPNQIDPAQQTAYENAIIDRIRSIQELRDVVKVRLIERPLPFDLTEQQTEALKIGRWLRASFVLRPFAVEGVQEPRLTVVNHLDFFNSESRIGEKFPNAQLANLDQLALPNDLALLAETMLAFVLTERESYGKAAQIIGDVLKSPKLPDAAPSRWALNLLRGDDFAFSGNATKAIAEYREAIRLKPDLPEAHTNLGATLGDEGQHDAAIVELREAIRLKSDSAAAHYNLGDALLHKGQYDAGIVETKKAIRLKPDFAQAHYNLAVILEQQGHDEDAIAEYEKTISINPHLFAPHNNLGGVLAKKGRLDDAVVQLKAAVQIRPDFAIARSNLGNVFLTKRQYDDAISQFSEEVRIDPHSARAHSDLANGLIRKEQYDAAIVEYREAIQLKPDFAIAHSNLGFALTQKGQYDDAIAECREAIQLKPDLAEAHYNLGVALKRTGQSAQATREFTEAHRLDPKLTPPD